MIEGSVRANWPGFDSLHWGTEMENGATAIRAGDALGSRAPLRRGHNRSRKRALVVGRRNMMANMAIKEREREIGS